MISDMASSILLTLIVIPAIYALVKGRRLSWQVETNARECNPSLGMADGGRT